MEEVKGEAPNVKLQITIRRGGQITTAKPSTKLNHKIQNPAVTLWNLFLLFIGASSGTCYLLFGDYPTNYKKQIPKLKLIPILSFRLYHS